MNATLNRRDLLRLGGLATLAGGLPGWLPRVAFSAAEPPPGDLLVCVFLRGGMDGLAAVPPLGEAEFHDARPTLALPDSGTASTEQVLNLDDRFGLHPSLTPLKGIFEEGDLALIHACGSPDPTHSHFEAMDYMERGTPGEKNLSTGWISRHLQTSYWTNDSPFRAVGVGESLPVSLRGPVPATALRSIAEFHLPGDPEAIRGLQETLSALYSLTPSDELGQQLADHAALTFSAIDMLANLDPGQYQPQGGASYDEDPFGQAMAQVAQLAKADLGLEVACLDLGGWDTHVQQEVTLPSLLATLASGLEAFYVDMGPRLESTTVVVMSEFGRRLRPNGGGGTDHGHGNAMFVLGGGIRGGTVYGDWPGLSDEALYGPGDLAVTTDFRTVLSEILVNRLGNKSTEQVFPGFEVRPFLGLTERLT